MKFRTLGVAAIVAATLVASGCSAAAPKPAASESDKPLTKISVAVSPSAGTSTPMYLGIKKGFFADNGLEVELTTLTNGQVAIPQVMSGQSQFSMSTFAQTVAAINQGLPIKVVNSASVVATNADTQFQGIVVKESYTAKTLAGTKTLAWQSTLLDPILADNFKKLGGDLTTMKILQVPLPSQIDTLLSGNADVALMNQPFLGQAIATPGLKLFSYIGPKQSLPGTPMAFFIGDQTYMKAHTAVTKGFIAAVAKSYAYGEAHKDEVSKYVPSTGLSDKPLPLISLPEYATKPATAAQWNEILDLFATYGSNPKKLTAKDVLYTAK